MAVCAIAGGAAFAISGALWVRSYRSDPAANSRGESILLLGALIVLLVGAVVMLHPAELVLMAELDAQPQAPTRLKLMTMLTAVTEVEFAVLRDGFGVSDPVLSKHLAALVDAGYVRSHKSMHQGRRTT